MRALQKRLCVTLQRMQLHFVLFGFEGIDFSGS